MLQSWLTAMRCLQFTQHYLRCCNPDSLLCDAFSSHNIIYDVAILTHCYAMPSVHTTFVQKIIYTVDWILERHSVFTCVQLTWSPVTLSYNIPFFLRNIFFSFPATNSFLASAAWLANLWYACPKLLMKRYFWHAAFTAVPMVFNL